MGLVCCAKRQSIDLMLRQSLHAKLLIGVLDRLSGEGIIWSRLVVGGGGLYLIHTAVPLLHTAAIVSIQSSRSALHPRRLLYLAAKDKIYVLRMQI